MNKSIYSVRPILKFSKEELDVIVTVCNDYQIYDNLELISDQGYEVVCYGIVRAISLKVLNTISTSLPFAEIRLVALYFEKIQLRFKKI